MCSVVANGIGASSAFEVTGKDRHTTEIRADRLQMLGSRSEQQAGKPEPWEGQPKVLDPFGLAKSVEEDPYPF